MRLWAQIKNPLPRVIYFPLRSSATSRLVDPRRLRPRLAILAFRPMASNSYKAPAFDSYRRIKQFMRLWGQIKNPLPRVLYFPLLSSATSRLVDPRRSRPRLAILAFRLPASNSYKAPAFDSYRRIKQFMRLWGQIKNPLPRVLYLPPIGIEPISPA